MALEGVPLYIANDQALHGGAASRALVYASYSGVEGVLTPTAFKIEEAATPDTFVTFRPGAYAAIARGVSQELQMYEGVARTGGQVDIPATDSSGGRTDLIVVQVEDPGDGTGQWSTPADPVNGPYEYVRRIHDVPPGTTSIHELEATLGPRTAVDLARIDIPVSTATIEQSYITDLRFMTNARVLPVQEYNTGHSAGILETTSTTPVQYPQENGSFDIFVPLWATRAKLRIDVILAGCRESESGSSFTLYGNNDLYVNGNNVQGFAEWNQDWNGGIVQFLMTTGSDFDCTEYQGQTVTIQNMAWIQGGVSSGALIEQNGTSVLLSGTFTEDTI